MGLLSAISGVIEGVGLPDLVGNFLGSSLNLSGFASDILSGAITNAAVAGIAGGDVGKAALFGAVGGGIGGTTLGGWGNELGAAVSGFGLDKSLGGNGLLGAASGALGSHLKERSSLSSNTNQVKTQTGATVGGANGANIATDNAAISTTPSTSGITERLRQLGLVDPNGDGTMLGKALMSGVGAMAQAKSAKDLLNQQTEQRKEIDRHQAELDHEAEQKRIAAFTNKGQTFQVVRHG